MSFGPMMARSLCAASPTYRLGPEQLLLLFDHAPSLSVTIL